MSWKLSKNITNNSGVITKFKNWCYWNTANYGQKKMSVNTKSTIDKSEVELFSKFMNDWWKPNGPFSALLSYNVVRVPFIRDGFAQCSSERNALQPLANKHILDVGCGGGFLSEDLAKLGAKITGIDASKDLIEVAKAHAEINPEIENNKPTYHHETIEEHAAVFVNHYDCVVASEVIDHVNNPPLFVQSCAHTLKPGGKIFFSTLNRTRISQFLLIFLCENVLKEIPRGTHHYDKFVTPKELTFMLEQNNYHAESSCGFQFNPITKTWKRTKHHQLMYGILAHKSN